MIFRERTVRMNENRDGMSYEIRRMRAEDLPSVSALEKTCFTEPWSDATLRSILESSLDTLWVLQARDTDLAAAGRTRDFTGEDPAPQIIGYLNYREIAGEGELDRVGVLPEYRGQGLGEKLLVTMLEYAKDRGVKDITLEVRAGNEPAKGLYGKYGFQTEGVRKNYYTHPAEDALIMWKHE